MNTRQQAIDLSVKVDKLIDPKKGILIVTFFDASSKEVRFKHMTSNLTQNSFSCHIETFTNDISQTTTYDIYHIQDIS